jgi:hypothetical protein
MPAALRASRTSAMYVGGPQTQACALAGSQCVLGDVPGNGMLTVKLGWRGLTVEQCSRVRQRLEQGAGLGGERMFPRAARTVDPPDLPFTACLRELVQYRQDRGHADAGGDQQHRS